MKYLLLIILSVCRVLSSQAQQILDLNSGEMKRGVTSTVPTRDIEELEDGYLVTYTFDKAMIQQDDLFSGTIFWKMDGFGLNDIPGDPCTLGRNDQFAIPFGFIPQVEVIDSAYRDFSYELTPARQALGNSSDEVYSKQNVIEINPYDGFKPTATASLSEIQSYRGHGICQITVSPIQYNYHTKTVRAYTSITYKVSFLPDRSSESKDKNLLAHISLEDNFLSNNFIGGNKAKTNGAKSGNTPQNDVRDYLILTTNTYATAAKRFADWKRLMGFNVHIYIDDNWTSTSVADTVAYAYANLPALYYLLIIGDHGDVPGKKMPSPNFYTDFYYRCMDNDIIPDIYCGRLSVKTSSEATTVIDKIIGYEQAPPADSAFYNNALHCAFFEDKNYNNYEDRRFTLTSEDVRSYVMTKGKTIQRVYFAKSDVEPKYWNNTFFSDGDSIPYELRKPGFAWNGDADDISNAINSGAFYVLYQGHGGYDYWDNPLYNKRNIYLNLSNGNLLPVVFSITCMTGKFFEECFAEAFLRKSNGGCVAIFAASNDAISGFDDALSTGMIDAIWPSPGLSIVMPLGSNSVYSVTPTPTYTLGQIMGQGMIRMKDTFYTQSGNVTYVNEIYHCFGDPSMKIYTQKPTAFDNVSIARNMGSISVSLAVGDTARITAYNPATGEVQSYIGNSATIATLNPEETAICVSAHNRIPYIQCPDVMYIQNTNITGTLDETHDIIKVGNHVTTTIDTGNVTTSNANITLRANKVILESGTKISTGSSLKTINP